MLYFLHRKNLNELELMQKKLVDQFNPNAAIECVKPHDIPDPSNENSKSSFREKNIQKCNPNAEEIVIPRALNNQSSINLVDNSFNSVDENDETNYLSQHNQNKRFSQPYLISACQCKNVTNTVNITLNHASKHLSDADKTGNNKSENLNSVEPQNQILCSESLCGTYDIDETISDDKRFEVCESFSNENVDGSASLLPDQSNDVLDNNSHVDIFPPLEQLEESVKQLSMVLSNVCDDAFYR